LSYSNFAELAVLKTSLIGLTKDMMQSRLYYKASFWRMERHYRVCQKWPNLFLSKLCQISTKFDNFWHIDSQNDEIMSGTLTVYLT